MQVEDQKFFQASRQNEKIRQENSVREFLSNYERLSAAKDVDGLTALYETNHVAYDVVPPFARRGVEETREALKHWLDMYSGPLDFSFEDIRIYFEGSLAVAHALVHSKGDVRGELLDGWTRSTLVLKNVDGDWKIVHDHSSLPVDMQSMKAVMTPSEAEIRDLGIAKSH